MVIRSARFNSSSVSVETCPKTQLQEYVLVGRSNVGKSSLINGICGQKNLAKTSSTPGKTRLINHFLIDENWFLVDLPGYGYAVASKKDKKKIQSLIINYLTNRKQLVKVYVLVDLRHPPLKIDLDFLGWLNKSYLPLGIVFTKADKLHPELRNQNLIKYKKVLETIWEELPTLFVTSSATGMGIDKLIAEINTLHIELNALKKEILKAP